jgi:hypothetical protein
MVVGTEGARTGACEPLSLRPVVQLGRRQPSLTDVSVKNVYGKR